MKTRTLLAALLVCALLLPALACAQGLLPPLNVGMPSIGDALHRYTDNVIDQGDGTQLQQWYNITADDYATISDYLATTGLELKDYSFDGATVRATLEKDYREFSLEYDPATETMTVTYPAGTYDTRFSAAEAHYVTANALLAEGKYIEAKKEYTTIVDYAVYRDVADKLEENKEFFLRAERTALAAECATKLRSVGSTVTYGSYEQDGDMFNGPEPIEWIVLDVQDGKSLLISKYGLDTQQYNEEYVDITWEECTLRAWLNAEFYNAAFSAEEQAAILLTDVDNSASQGDSEWNTNGGNDTQDCLFLLSYAEAGIYFSDDTARMCTPTDHAVKQGAWTSSKYEVDDRPTGWWWLRSPGSNQSSAALVLFGGSRSDYNVARGGGSVRPAFWLNLESDIF